MQRVSIWGTGKWGGIALELAKKYSWEVIAMIDNDINKLGQTFHDLLIYTPEEYALKVDRNIPILVGCISEEVDRQALAYSNFVIPHRAVVGMSAAVHTPFPATSLHEENLNGCEVLADRNVLLHKFAKSGNKMVMAEIGVAFGDYSEQILKICKPKKLLLIDAWESNAYEAGLTTVNQRFADEINNGIVEIHRGYSIDKLQEIEDDSLDWVYIDTVHDYDTTTQELILCARKVKDSGFICGHDFAKFNSYACTHYGVYDAVCRFAKEYGYRFRYLTMESHGLQSFCLQKL